jgi:hypothetical protein
MKLIRR